MAFATTKLLRIAEDRVRERLQRRPLVPLVESMVGNAHSEDVSKLGTVSAELAKVIGVDAGHLRASETLRDCLRVSQEELGGDSERLMRKVGLKHDIVDPFAFALLDMVERTIRQNPARLENAAFSPMPKNEDEWVERILDMTVADYLRALV